MLVNKIKLYEQLIQQMTASDKASIQSNNIKQRMWHTWKWLQFHLFDELCLLPAAYLWCILEGMADLSLFYVVYVPEASLSSADKQLEGSMGHLSVFARCMPFWFWQFDAYSWFEEDKINVHVQSKMGSFWMYLRQLWLTGKADASYEMYVYFCNADFYSVLKIWSVETTYTQSEMYKVWACVCLHPLSVSPPGFQSWRW